MTPEEVALFVRNSTVLPFPQASDAYREADVEIVVERLGNGAFLIKGSRPDGSKLPTLSGWDRNNNSFVLSEFATLTEDEEPIFQPIWRHVLDRIQNGKPTRFGIPVGENGEFSSLFMTPFQSGTNYENALDDRMNIVSHLDDMLQLTGYILQLVTSVKSDKSEVTMAYLQPRKDVYPTQESI